jgi:hypothetical protein
MSRKLDLPADLASLIEKRERDERRTGKDRRTKAKAVSPAKERRKSSSRRKKKRRAD